MREASVAEKVLAETFKGKWNIVSVFTLNTDEVIKAGLNFLGKGYNELKSGVYRSADGLRQFRIDNGSLTGAHRPNIPHVYFELYAPGANKPYVNNHVPFHD